jgi:hypothetical protein
MEALTPARRSPRRTKKRKKEKRKKRVEKRETCRARYYAIVLLSRHEDDRLTRPARVFVEGGFYHVYNRLGRGERVFAAEHEAAEFTRILKEVAERDDVTVLAWCLLATHS